MRNFLIACTALSIAAGCTTTRTINAVGAASAGQVEPGKTVTIEFVDGSREKVTIRRYGPTGVEVRSADNTVSSLDYADIRSMQTKELDGVRTAGAVGGVLLLFGLAQARDDVAFFPSAP